VTDGLKWPLRVAHDRRDGVLVLTLSGRIGHASAPGLRKALGAAMTETDRQVVIDLGGVDYVSSAGILVLVEAGERLRTRQGELALCAVSEAVQIVLRLADATSRFAIEPSCALAVARLARR
jgi:stage II sporulation protein AA (anti-sigma F factor antagonist)